MRGEPVDPEEARRMRIYVRHYVERLRHLDLYVTRDGKTLWSGSLDAWQRVQLD